MADVPSLILKGLGIVLILIGLSGTLGGFYALNVVHGYGPEEVSASTGIVKVEENLNQRREEITTNIAAGKEEFGQAAVSVSDAGSTMETASVNMASAVTAMKGASSKMEEASAANQEAGDLLEDAAAGLSDWADAYSFNGSPLPRKSDFKAAVAKIEDASASLKETGDGLSSGSESLGQTANALNGTRVKLEETSLGLKDTGTNLQKAGDKFGALEEPSHSVISEMISPLEDTTEGLASRGNTKTYVYGLIGYFILIHIIMLGLGVSLVIIEINLFYPMA